MVGYSIDLSNSVMNETTLTKRTTPLKITLSLMDAERWQVVLRRKRRVIRNGKMDTAGGQWNEKDEGIVSFYFSEFPDTHGAIEMHRAFEYYGNVVDVVIPQKRNKRGKRFGFVRFREVEDPRTFAIKLDNIIIGAKKIHVNIPRFQRVKHWQREN